MYVYIVNWVVGLMLFVVYCSVCLCLCMHCLTALRDTAECMPMLLAAVLVYIFDDALTMHPMTLMSMLSLLCERCARGAWQLVCRLQEIANMQRKRFVRFGLVQQQQQHRGALIIIYAERD